MIETKDRSMQYTWIFIIISTIISLTIKFIYRDFNFSDYVVVLERWVGTMQTGGITTLKDPFYDYTPGYMYLLYVLSKFNVNSLYTIKLSSIVFEYICAIYVGKLAFLYLKREWYKWLPLGIIPLLPSVILNSGFMSQCDVVYVTFMIASVYYVFTKKQILGMVLLGIAFAIKFQAVMIMPFYFVFMLRGHIKWYMFLVVPLTYIASILPVAIMGRDFWELLFFYGQQANSQDWRPLTIFFPNIYSFSLVGSMVNGVKWPGYLFIFVVVLLGGFYLKGKKFKFDYPAWVTLMLLSAVICPYFLPGMHERYMFLGDIVAVLYVMVNYKNIMNWIVALGVQFISWFSVTLCLATEGVYFDRSGFDFNFFWSLLPYLKYRPAALFFFLILLYIIYDLFKRITNKEAVNFFK